MVIQHFVNPTFLSWYMYVSVIVQVHRIYVKHNDRLCVFAMNHVVVEPLFIYMVCVCDESLDYDNYHNLKSNVFQSAHPLLTGSEME